ncbi:hypothetical protein Q4O60_01710 [Aeribacillus pallidus]|nr:hypothetical protein [Aeribacillus pallidus]
MLGGGKFINDYLKGFIDGYTKAQEQIGNVSINLDARKLAKSIYKDIEALIKLDKQRKNHIKQQPP